MTVDRSLGMDREISRRDFVGGAAVAVGALGAPGLLQAQGVNAAAPAYPPAKMGMRGSHEGSFESAHALRDGALDPSSAIGTDQTYDLVIFGLSGALHGEITFAGGRVEQSNFHNYRVLRMREAPAVETHILENRARPGGVGEAPTAAVAPALANAVFAATGKRIRTLPLAKALKGADGGGFGGDAPSPAMPPGPSASSARG